MERAQWVLVKFHYYHFYFHCLFHFFVMRISRKKQANIVSVDQANETSEHDGLSSSTNCAT